MVRFPGKIILNYVFIFKMHCNVLNSICCEFNRTTEQNHVIAYVLHLINRSDVSHFTDVIMYIITLL